MKLTSTQTDYYCVAIREEVDIFVVSLNVNYIDMCGERDTERCCSCITIII